MNARSTTHDPDELAAAERSSGLVLAGFLDTGSPPTLVPIFVRPGRSADELSRLVERLNGVIDQAERRAA